MLCINAVCSFFHWFYFPHRINTFYKSLATRLLIFVLNSGAVSTSLKNAYLCFCIFPWEKRLWIFFSKRTFLTLDLREVIFPFEFFDVRSSHGFFRYSVFTFFLFNCVEPSDIRSYRKSFHCYLVFNYFYLILESDLVFSLKKEILLVCENCFRLVNTFKCRSCWGGFRCIFCFSCSSNTSQDSLGLLFMVF